MKKTIFVIAAIIISFAGFNKSEAHRYNRYRTAVTFDYFYVTLSPYGEWIEIDYDVYAWHPYDVPYNWRPYAIGRWAWTEYGWYWESYEPFGWATYHYGRWFYDDYYGWLWIPGYEWAPAWVEWRYNDYYIGWAPLPPYARFDVNFGIRFSISWRTPYRHWHFVRYNNFCRPNVNVYIENNNYRIYSRTKYRTNYYERNGRIINYGVDKRIVEHRGNFRVRETKLRTVSSPHGFAKRDVKRTNEIRMFRPSEREVKSVKKARKYNVTKSGRKTSLRTEKLAVKVKRERNPGTIKKVNTRKDNDNKSKSPVIYRNKGSKKSVGKLSEYESKGIERKPSRKIMKNGYRTKEKRDVSKVRERRKTVSKENVKIYKMDGTYKRSEVKKKRIIDRNQKEIKTKRSMVR